MKKLLVFALLLNAVLLAGRFWQELPVSAQAGPVASQNGDVDGNGSINITDAVYILRWLFQRGPAPVACAQAGGLTPEQAEILSHMSIVEIPTETDEQGNVLGTAKTIRVTGVNVQIVSGLGATHGNPAAAFDGVNAVTNGLGNLIVGYNEERRLSLLCAKARDRMADAPFCQDIRTGSHNIVVGSTHSYTSFGGLVAGKDNTISGAYASVSGGSFNEASGEDSPVSGGRRNTASGESSSVGGGFVNEASGENSSVSGGGANTASGVASSVSGGARNTASGKLSSVSGGAFNTASGESSSVSGGGGRQEAQGNEAAGDYSTVSGGRGNVATARASHVP